MAARKKAAKKKAARKRKAKPSKLALEVIEFIEGYLKTGEGGYKLGEPLVLLPFQKAWIAKTFGNPRPSRSILSTARKNGKTCLGSALVLCALLGPLRQPGGQIISASMSREQAGIVFRYAVKMLRVSGLDHLVTIRESAKEIIHGATGTTFRAISAEHSTSHGLSPYLVVFDELGQARGPRLPLFDSLSTSLGAYENGLMVIISTQGPDDSCLLSLVLDDALSGADPRNVASLHCAPEGADIFKRPAWKAANPALGVFRSEQDVKTQAAEAQRLASRESSFAQLTCNLRVSTDDPFLSAEVFKRCQRPASAEVFARGPCFAGLDLGARQDLCALAIVAEDENGLIHCRLEAWTPADTLLERAARDRAPYDLWVDQNWLRTTPGVSIAWDHIARDIGEILAPIPLTACLFDRWRIADLETQLNAQGIEIPLEPCGQGFRDMGPAVEVFIHHALAGELRCGPSPLLAWSISNAVLESDSTGQSKLSKKRSFGRIDPAVALAMALRGLKIGGEPLGLLETEGLMFV